MRTYFSLSMVAELRPICNETLFRKRLRPAASDQKLAALANKCMGRRLCSWL
jgi:hypothetical protein